MSRLAPLRLQHVVFYVGWSVSAAIAMAPSSLFIGVDAAAWVSSPLLPLQGGGLVRRLRTTTTVTSSCFLRGRSFGAAGHLHYARRRSSPMLDEDKHTAKDKQRLIAAGHDTALVTSRRACMAKAAASAVAAVATTTAAPWLLTDGAGTIVQPCWAAEMSTTVDSSSSSSTMSNMEQVNTLLAKLHDIPTFCIVRADTGAAYMAYQQDLNMAMGYAFVTFPGALAVLADAQKVAREKNYADVWQDATITTIPLDIAVRLTLKKRSRSSQKDQTLETLLKVIPGADERLDGMAIDSRFKDQGRVPLFYVTEPSTAESNSITLYFNRLDLVADWNRRNNNADSSTATATSIPPIQTVDFVGMFEGILRGRGTGLPRNVALDKVVFVPNTESVNVAKELKERSKSSNNNGKGGLVPYNPNKMIV